MNICILKERLYDDFIVVVFLSQLEKISVFFSRMEELMHFQVVFFIFPTRFFSLITHFSLSHAAFLYITQLNNLIL